MYYIFLTISAFLISCQFLFLKMFQKEQGATVYSAAMFSLFVGVFQAIVSFLIAGCHIHFTLYSVLMSLLYCCCVITANTLGIKVMKLGKISVYTLFMMLGGMVVPFFWGVLFLNEKLKWIYVAALVLMSVALVLPALEKKEGGRSSLLFYLLCCVLFFTNGSISTVSKLHQIHPGAVDTLSFLFLIGVAEALISLLMLPFVKKDETPLAVIKKKKPVLFGLGFTAVNTVASILQFYSEKFVNASVLFPILTGGTIVFSALTAYLFFKEKVNKYAAASIGIAFAATLLFMF